MVDEAEGGATQVAQSPKKVYLPQVEKDEHRAMYKYYESLGPRRTLVRVAEKFGKSVPTIAKASRAFNWKLRLAQHLPVIDRVMEQAKEDIDSSRTKLIDVVVEISDTLHELSVIAKRVRRGDVDPELIRRRELLLEALGIWGFEWKSPRDFKSLMDTLKVVSDVGNVGVKQKKEAMEKKAQVPQVVNPTQINVEKFELNITDE